MDMEPVAPLAPELIAFWRRFVRWVVGMFQIVGGLFGLYEVFASPPNLNRLVFLTAFVLFAASICGGILLIKDRPIGMMVSLIIQALQVLQIAADGLMYSFYCGIEWVLGFYSSGMIMGFNMSWHWPAGFYVTTDPPSNFSPVGFTGMNLVAVAAIIGLLWVRLGHTGLSAPLRNENGELKDSPETSSSIWPPPPAGPQPPEK